MRPFLAPNPGPFTLDGTRSYVVGGRRAAVIDPGPSLDAHLSVLTEAVEGAEEVVVLLTHAHGDHSEGSGELARRLGAEVAGPGSGREVADGEVFNTSAGDLVAVSTPGHARRHFCYHLPDAGAVFVGDLVLGTGNTTWIGEYPGGVADYLDSLARLEGLNASALYPGHGELIREPAEAIDRFRRHRLARIEEVRHAVAEVGDADAAALALCVYGPLPPGVREMAVSSVEAALDYLSGAE